MVTVSATGTWCVVDAGAFGFAAGAGDWAAVWTGRACVTLLIGLLIERDPPELSYRHNAQRSLAGDRSLEVPNGRPTATFSQKPPRTGIQTVLDVMKVAASRALRRRIVDPAPIIKGFYMPKIRIARETGESRSGGLAFSVNRR